MNQSEVKVAFIGLGGMGSGMAKNILAAGFDLTVYSRTAAKAAPLVGAGARAASSAREAADGAQLIISMVGDDEDSRAVWLGENGVLAGTPQANCIAVECSTLSLDWVRRLSQRCRDAGLRYLDCPVTGGRAGASAGTLTLLMGGDEAAVRDAAPVLNHIGGRLVYFGAVGSATSYKLLVNLMVGVQAAGLAEALALAKKAGLEMTLVLEELCRGAAASPVVKAYAPRMAAGNHGEPIQFISRWVHKDLTYAGQLAAELGQPSPTLAAAAGLFAQSAARLPDSNVSAVIETLM